MATDVAGSGLPWIEDISRSFAPHPFVAFHREELPSLNRRHGALVAGDLRGVPGLAFRIEDGTTFAWTADAEGVAALPPVTGTADFPTQEQQTAAQQVVAERWNAEISG